MFCINVPATYSYDGANNLSLYLQVLCSDRNYSKASGARILLKDYTAGGTLDGTTFNTAIWDIYTALGYNPFAIIRTFTANDGKTLDETGRVVKQILSAFDVDFLYMPRNDTSSDFTDYKINNVAGQYAGTTAPGDIRGNLAYFNHPTGCFTFYISDDTNGHCYFTIHQFSEHAYEYGAWDNNAKYITIEGDVYFHKDALTNNIYCTGVTITAGGKTTDAFVNNIFSVQGVEPEVDKPGNPYIDPTGGSGGGGGDGEYGDSDPTSIDPTAIPDVPNISAITTGLITTYLPTLSQVQALGNFMWSSAFDETTFKKLFADPMQAIIGLGIIPITPTAGGTKSCKLGDVDTGVSMPYVSNQFVQKSCGSVAIKKEVGCFMDYTDTDISIYLPYCGMHQLNTEDVMGDTVTVTYNIDVVSGGCTAIVSTASKGVLYQFSGNCIANVPLTSINYSTAIQNAVSGAIGIAGTALGAATGTAPLTAVGAAGLAKSAANIAMNKHGSVGRSGNMAGAAGLMAVQTPFLIITRPRRSVPKDLNKYTGYTYNVTMKLGQAVGFTMIDFIRLDSIPCTGSERDELYNLLQEGVIF